MDAQHPSPSFTIVRLTFRFLFFSILYYIRLFIEVFLLPKAQPSKRLFSLTEN